MEYRIPAAALCRSFIGVFILRVWFSLVKFAIQTLWVGLGERPVANPPQSRGDNQSSIQATIHPLMMKLIQIDDSLYAGAFTTAPGIRQLPSEYRLQG